MRQRAQRDFRFDGFQKRPMLRDFCAEQLQLSLSVGGRDFFSVHDLKQQKRAAMKQGRDEKKQRDFAAEPVVNRPVESECTGIRLHPRVGRKKGCVEAVRSVLFRSTKGEGDSKASAQSEVAGGGNDFVGGLAIGANDDWAAG